MTQIGCHLSIEKGIDNAIYTAIEEGANALQIFLSSPHRASAGKPLKNPDDLKAILENTGVYLVVHGKYILNFCRPDLKWQYDALANDLHKANQLGSEIGVVIHQGKNVKKLDRQEALQNFVNGVSEVLEMTKELSNPIILENSCQQGTELGYTLEELAEIFKLFKPKYRKRLGFCLDTCHIYVAGTLQMKTNHEVDSFFRKFEKLIGLKYLKVIHFNDSKTPFDGHNDHHQDLNHGYITNASLGGTTEGLERVVAWAKQYEIPLILETPRDIMTCRDQIQLVEQWASEAPDIVLEKPKLNVKFVRKTK